MQWSRGRAALATVVAGVTFCGTTAVAGAGSPTHFQLASSYASNALPSPAHLIVGAPITLPSALFVSAAPGASSLVSPAQARSAATVMWNAWQTALHANDTLALSQLAVPGPMLDGTIYNCAFPSGQCAADPQQPTLSQLEVAVPKQRSYPVYFMSAILTTNAVQNDGGASQVEPWMELQILTKASRTAPWQLTFDSGYNAIGAVAPPFPPFDFGVGRYGPSSSDRAYNGDPAVKTVVTKGIGTGPTAVRTDDYLSLLATYWQSYKYAGHAPKNPVFLDGGDSSGEGKFLAGTREGSLYDGSRDTYRFSFDHRAGMWRFTVGGGYPMVCGSVLDAATITPRKGFLNQNSDEENYGVPLRPGSYFSITTSAEHEVCVYYASGGTDNALGGLMVAGNDVYASAVTGRQAPEDLVDLEISYGILNGTLNQSNQQYTKCETSNGNSCMKNLAISFAQQFGEFEKNLMSESFPAAYEVQAHALEKSANQLYGLYESLSRATGSSKDTSSIEESVQKLRSEYNELEKELSNT